MIAKLLFKLFKNIYMKHLDKIVDRYYRQYHFDMGYDYIAHNNEGDAFKHTYMSAELTILFGERIAEQIGLLQENTNPLNNKERDMDLYNNEMGRTIGKELLKEYNRFILLIIMNDLISDIIIKLMRADELITSV